MDTSCLSMGSNNSQASNIPLPPGSPPPLSQHQQQNPPRHQQQSSIPVFGINSGSPMTFASLARTRENVIESTLYQYGPGPAIQMPSAMSRTMQNSSAATMSNLMGQQQQPNLRHQQQQQHLQRQQHIRMAYQTSQQFQNQQLNLLQGSPAITHNNSVQGMMARPPIYLTNSLSVHCQPTPVSSVPTYLLNPGQISSTGPANPSSSHTMSHPPATQSTISQPIAPLSPPLDAIRSNHPNNIVITIPPIDEQQQAPDESRSKPPIPEKDCMTQVKENWEKWTVNEMMQKYRDLSTMLEKAQASRANIEKEINDIVRKHPGLNVELNPVFLRKKQDQASFNLKCEDINRAMKFVGDKCNSKYGRKLENTNSRQPLHNPRPTQQVKRMQKARMSTGKIQSATPKIDLRDKKNFLLDLKDSEFWCQACDCLFDSLKEFCDHLHKREHRQNMDVTSQRPWQHHSSPKKDINKFTTFSLIRSICSEINSTSDTEFTMRHLDAALNPSIKDEKDLSQLSINRDRKQFDENDRLFSFKGYDELVPINGFYCKLCDRTLCDETEVERHLKGYSHNYEHTKSVALQSTHERDFRMKMERSLKLHKDERARKSKTTVVSKSKDAGPNAATNPEPGASTSNGLSSHWSARLPYKKPTSRIVDEHDVLADKIEKRKERDHAKTNTFEAAKKTSFSESTRKTESTKLHKSPVKTHSPKRYRDRTMPEIMPVSDNQPAASLKRLKRSHNEGPRGKQEMEKKEAPTKTIDNIEILSYSTEDEEEEEEEEEQQQQQRGMLQSAISEPYTKPMPTFEPFEEVHLERGDPDSPFPELDIFITGNVPVSVLKDVRLRQDVKVRLNRINLDDYKDMLFDRSNMWARVDMLMTKKEPGEFESNLETGIATDACFFDNDGKAIPVSVDCDSSDCDDKEEPFKISDLSAFFCNDA